MRKLLSLLCAVALTVGAVFPVSAAVADPQTLPDFGAMQNISGANNDRTYEYATAALNNGNYANLKIQGNTIHVSRRAAGMHNGPDQVFVLQNQAVVLERQADWVVQTDGSGLSGYDLYLDASALASGTYTLQIRSKSSYVYTFLELGFTKGPTDCYFPKNNSISKQYNYGALQKLESGAGPNDFQDLVDMYEKGDDSHILQSIQRKAQSLVAGKSTDVQKVNAIYRWIVENIAYDTDVADEKYAIRIKEYPADSVRLDNPLNAFSQGYALCYGFARLTTLMMGYAGVDCVCLTGRLAGPNTVNINNEIGPDVGTTQAKDLNHCWNAVKISGSWYFLDPSEDALHYYYRSNKNLPSTGYTTPTRSALYRYTFPALDAFSDTRVAVRIGVKNSGTRITPAKVADGWVKSGSTSYFYMDGEKVRNEWKRIDGQLYYFNSSGAVAKGWQQTGACWRYFDEDGAMATGTLELKDGEDTRVYTFDSQGCLTGDSWVSFLGKTRYLSGREMAIGWQYVEGRWRYFDNTGALYRDAEKPLELDGRQYLVTEQGALRVEESGWVTFQDEKHYFDGELARTGLQLIDGQEYLFDDQGVLQTGWSTVDGKTYYIDTEGRLLLGWQLLEGGWYHFSRESGMLTGVQSIGGGSHYFDSQGRLATEGWVNVGSGQLYFTGVRKKSGAVSGSKMLTGWRRVDNELRYFDPETGIMYTGSEEKYNENSKKWYTFSKDGVATAKK